MSQTGLRSPFDLSRPPSSTARWLTAAALLVSASCAQGDDSDLTCDDGLSLCASVCVDTQADPDHCGACGSVCATGRRCEAGACIGGGGEGGDAAGEDTDGGSGGLLCAPDLAACDGGCVDLRVNPRHCGGCGHACAADERCEGGACVCDAGLEACDGGCVDLTSDPHHCGGCDTRCAHNGTCSDGACLCNEGLVDCDGKCVDLMRSPEHCGECGAACGPGLVCQAGTCACLVGDYEDIGGAVPQVLTGSTLGAETYFGLACLAAGSSEIVYRFTAEEAGNYRFDTAGSSYDTAIGLLGFDVCDERACNDDRGGPEASATVSLEEGEAILVVVTGYNGAQGDFALRIDRTVPPVCPAGNIEPTLPQTVTGDTTLLGDAVVPSCGSVDTPDASYTFTAPRAGRYIFDTAGSAYNTVLELRSGSCTGSVIACNDNTGDTEQSRAAATLSAGQTVVAIVDGIDGDSGPFTLNVIEYVPPPCPEHTLGSTFPQTVTGTTAIMDRVSALSSPCASGGGPEATYAFTAPADALYTFDTFGTSFDTVLHVHDATCSGPNLGCNDDTSGVQSQVKVRLREGQTVVAVVDGYAATSSGAYTLNVSQTAIPPCPEIDLGTTVPQTVTGTTAGAVDIMNSTCGGANASEVTYAFTAPSAGTYIFDTFGSSFNTVLYARDVDCSGAVLKCNGDAGGGVQSRLTMDLAEGQTILLVIDGSSASASGEFTLTAQRYDGGGTCSTPIDLGSTVPQVVTGSTAEQPESVTPACGVSSAPEMIYSFTAPDNGIYIFNTFGSSFDTILQVYDGSCAGTPLRCNDDAGGPQSRVTVDLVAGQTVLVVVDGRSTNRGDYVLQVDRFDGMGTCATPIDLGSELPVTRTGNTAGLPNSVTPSCATASTASEMAFTYTAPADGSYVISTIGSSYDTVLHVHSNRCRGRTLSCNDDSGGGGTSRMTLTLTAGQVITIVVDGYNSASGNFTLNISAAPR
ncbi:MXAN_6577-like cysteine-rich protein [Sorangium sp. So ce1097]|uniref:MXAN_6577-like cysteine-rich protein n=1 Tax=Sorangium sp. So ce1097 TaxID=3133330 RepID=UPI003F5E7186